MPAWFKSSNWNRITLKIEALKNEDHFFKNEAHFYPRVSYAFQNAKIVNFDCGIRKFRTFLEYLLLVLLTILAFFVSAIRFELLFISLFNLAASCFDIVDILCLLKTPRKSLHFSDFILNIEQSAEPIIIHRLSATSKLDKIEHKCFQYRDNKLTETDRVPESSEVNRLREEFVKQFDLES